MIPNLKIKKKNMKLWQYVEGMHTFLFYSGNSCKNAGIINFSQLQEHIQSRYK